jgi:hypothetical protein
MTDTITAQIVAARATVDPKFHWAFHDGEQAAYYAGSLGSGCPYAAGTPKQDAWLAGYHARRAALGYR